jgi:hypothetical protein
MVSLVRGEVLGWGVGGRKVQIVETEGVTHARLVSLVRDDANELILPLHCPRRNIAGC